MHPFYARHRDAAETWAMLVVALLLALSIGGCAQLGLQTPQSPEDSLRYSQAVLTGAYQTVGDAAEAKTLSATEARSYFNRLEQAKRDLDAADRVISATPKGGAIPADIVGRLNFALTALNVIAGELRSRLPASATKALPPSK